MHHPVLELNLHRNTENCMKTNYTKVNNQHKMTDVASGVFVNHSELLIPAEPRLILTEKESTCMKRRLSFVEQISALHQTVLFTVGAFHIFSFVRHGCCREGEQSWFNFGLVVLCLCFVLFISVFHPFFSQVITAKRQEISYNLT